MRRARSRASHDRERSAPEVTMPAHAPASIGWVPKHSARDDDESEELEAVLDGNTLERDDSPLRMEDPAVTPELYQALLDDELAEIDDEDPDSMAAYALNRATGNQ
jgi:hypothetical protein